MPVPLVEGVQHHDKTYKQNLAGIGAAKSAEFEVLFEVQKTFYPEDREQAEEGAEAGLNWRFQAGVVVRAVDCGILNKVGVSRRPWSSCSLRSPCPPL